MRDIATTLRKHVDECLVQQTEKFAAVQSTLQEAFPNNTFAGSEVSGFAADSLYGKQGIGISAPLLAHWLFMRIMRSPDDVQHIKGSAAAAAAFSTAVVESICPLEPAQFGATIKDAKTNKRACTDVEDFFLGAATQLIALPAGARRPLHAHGSITVVHDEQGDTPLALRKQSDESTALTLVPLNFYGATLPAGSVVELDQRHCMLRTGSETSTKHGKPVQLQTFAAENNTLALKAVLRCTPWAHSDPLDRGIFAIDVYRRATNEYSGYISVMEARYNGVTATNIQTFQDAARAIMHCCGVMRQMEHA